MQKETKAVPDSTLWMDPCEMYGVPFEPTEVEADGSFVIDVVANKAMNEAEYRWTRAIMGEPVVSALRACYELGRKSHRNADSTVGLVPSRSLFPVFLSHF